MKSFDDDMLPIQITDQSQDGSTVSFQITQDFVDSVVGKLSVHYHSSVSDAACNVESNVEFGWTSEDYTATCFEGKADVKVYLYLCGREIETDRDYCQRPSDNLDDYLELSFILDCEEICETEGPTFSPTVSPTTGPSASPTIIPTAGPTSSPIEQPEEQCYDGPILLPGSECADNSVRLQIAAFDDNAQFVTVRRSIDSMITIGYTTWTGSGSQGMSVTQELVEDNQAIDLKCSSSGFADITVGYESCSYEVRVPCDINDMCDAMTYTPSDSPTPCVDVFSITPSSSNSDTTFEHIDVSKADTDSDALSITITKPAKYDAMTVVYTSSDGLNTVQVPGDDTTFLAYCTGGDVNVDVILPGASGCTEDCQGWECEDILHSFTISCESDCADETYLRQDRRMHEEAFKHDPVPISDDEDAPYCLSADYPCEGEEENMVHVCHYSARQGYQTFCVPEADSDILRFYPHDYCGTCKYGSS
jgi:hypothetical protein